MISCTIFVKYDYSSQTNKDYLDRLDRAVKDPGSVCIKFDSNMSDPDCKVPREVDDVSDRK